MGIAAIALLASVGAGAVRRMTSTSSGVCPKNPVDHGATTSDHKDSAMAVGRQYGIMSLEK
jgi:hypothetical protein